MESQNPFKLEEDENTPEYSRMPLELPEVEGAKAVEIDEKNILADGIKMQANFDAAKEQLPNIQDGSTITEVELDRRHEIQDDPGTHSTTKSVKEILKSDIATGSASEEFLSINNKPVTGKPAGYSYVPSANENTSSFPASSPKVTYASAIKIGFFMAVALIILFILLNIAT